MALVRWNHPVAQLAGLEVERLHRMFDDLYVEAGNRTWLPPVDIYETTDKEVVIKAELPDMKREEIGVSFENNVLTLRGERRADEGVAADRFHHRERRHGAFSRSFTLPSTVDASRIAASYKDGVLTVRLPQREEARPKQIVVEG